MARRRINSSQVLRSISGSSCSWPTMSIDKLCDKGSVLIDLLSANAKLVQLLEQCSPGWVNILGLVFFLLVSNFFDCQFKCGFGTGSES